MSSAQVRAHAIADHLGLFHDLLHRKLADDAAQMTFHHQPDQPFALRVGLRQKLLGRGLDRLRIALHLDLRDGFHRDRDALLGVEILLRRNIERHQLQRKLTAGFHHREDHRAAALDNPCSAETVNDDRLVRTGLPIQPGNGHHQREQRDHHQPGNNNYFLRHKRPISF